MALETFIPKKFSPGSQRIIDTANAIMAEYAAQGYDLSLRQLYYQFVSRDILPNRQSEYKRLGSIISDARLAGMIDWSMISDRGRVVVANSHWGTPADMMRSAAQSYRIDKWKDQPTYVEVMVEKQALEGVLIPVCEELDIRFTANKGYSSSSAMYEASKRFVRARRQGKRPYVLYLGDHDPSGIDMTRDIDERLDLFTYHYGVKVNRLALNYDQVEEYEPPENPVKLALALNTPLPTPAGWTTMGECKRGDLLFGSDGHPYPITGKSKVFTDKNCLRFTFSGGDSIICSEDHLWAVHAHDRNGGIRTAKYLARHWREGKHQKPIYRVAVADPIQLPEVDLLIPPYVLGAWLGDGNSDAEGFACGLEDEEILDLVSGEGYRVARKPSYPVACTIYGLRGQLYRLGVANNKHIPAVYMRASHGQRLALLQGLMDTDGTVWQNRNMTPCSFTSTRYVLAQQFLELALSLGIRARIHEGRSAYNSRDCGPCWVIEFYPGDADIFRLSRKRLRLVGSKVARRQHFRTIINIEPAETTETQCLSIASPDHLFLAGRHFIPTHNTDSRAGGYCDRFGDSSWELDALEPSVLASLVEDAVLGLRDEELWEEAVEREEQERKVMFSLADRYENGEIV